MFILKKLDDGRVIKGELSILTCGEIISVANQHLRENTPQGKKIWHYLMQYQHAKYRNNNPVR